MVTIRNIDAQLITSESYTELLRAVKEELEEQKAFAPQVEFLTHTSAIIYHNEIPQEPEEAWSNRNCCECGNYDWGRGCPFREGHVTLMMPACKHFTIEVQEV